MNDVRTTELLDSLPALFRDPPPRPDDPSITDFPPPEDPTMEDFLAAFEEILLSKGPAGIEGKIDRLAETIDPALAPVEDLRWLAAWLGLTIDADYPTEREAQYRIFVAQTMSRYRQRGTLAGMKALLEHFTGQTSLIWQDTKPHGFVVSLSLYDVRDFNEMERLTRVAHALIHREKPAHTHYKLQGRFQTFQVADLTRKDGQLQPRTDANIASPAQVGHRKARKITVGNMMLGQAPLTTSNTTPKVSS